MPVQGRERGKSAAEVWVDTLRRSGVLGWAPYAGLSILSIAAFTFRIHHFSTPHANIFRELATVSVTTFISLEHLVVLQNLADLALTRTASGG